MGSSLIFLPYYFRRWRAWVIRSFFLCCLWYTRRENENLCQHQSYNILIKYCCRVLRSSFCPNFNQRTRIYPTRHVSNGFLACAAMSRELRSSQSSKKSLIVYVWSDQASKMSKLSTQPALPAIFVWLERERSMTCRKDWLISDENIRIRNAEKSKIFALAFGARSQS